MAAFAGQALLSFQVRGMAQHPIMHLPSPIDISGEASGALEGNQTFQSCISAHIMLLLWDFHNLYSSVRLKGYGNVIINEKQIYF